MRFLHPLSLGPLPAHVRVKQDKADMVLGSNKHMEGEGRQEPQMCPGHQNTDERVLRAPMMGSGSVRAKIISTCRWEDRLQMGRWLMVWSKVVKAGGMCNVRCGMRTGGNINTGKGKGRLHGHNPCKSTGRTCYILSDCLSLLLLKPAH